MYRLIILACFVSAINAAVVEESKSRIIGGKSISIEEAPYQVSIYDLVYNQHKCGGSIISPSYILTAAHCASYPAHQYRIRIGTSMRTEGKLLNVISVISHENFGLDRKRVLFNDIALMKLEHPIQINGKTTKIVELPKQGEKFTNKNALLTGWGQTASGKPSNQLQSLTVNVLSREQCDDYYMALFNGIYDGQVCAEHQDRNKDLCDGDSGGPLVVDGKQVGIVSWSGPGCAKPGRPGVYTEVSAYRNWIDKHMKA